MSKKVYLVSGSEDGPQGIYSNFKLAYQEALDYSCGGDPTLANLTYSQAVKSKDIVTISKKDSPYFNTAEISLYILNQ